jgi:ABC-type branched-subunit amino acid transport system ATPase component
VSISSHPDTAVVVPTAARLLDVALPIPPGHEPVYGDPTIAVRGLTKRYGHVAAVQELSFNVHPGTVVGFLGRNGAGKSTTLRILAGLSAPSSGTATIAGVPYRPLPRPMHVAGSVVLRVFRPNAWNRWFAAVAVNLPGWLCQ